ncbi:MAG: fluoride efflux transporter CrcB [Pseudonocardia sp.]|nr:fluoride efflux transporter CrcB [Pseudonocardia sp.]
MLTGTIRLYDGTRWVDCAPDDFVHVPEGGIHWFRDESGAPASMLLHFAPGAPREEYFEVLADAARREEMERVGRARGVHVPPRHVLGRRLGSSAMAVERTGRREVDPPRHAAVLGAVALGGVIGAEARWALGLVWPHTPQGFPWSTLVINVSGCLLMGVLMVVITEKLRPHPLVRPLLGVGVLGGYTTFSTYAVEAVQAVDSGRAWIALGYVVATPVLAVLAVAAGATGARALVRAS